MASKTRDGALWIALAGALLPAGVLPPSGEGPEGGPQAVASGTPLRTWAAEAPATGFGQVVVRAGDVDGDGHDDVALGLPRAGPEGRGAVWILSGADGSRLLEASGGTARERFGAALAVADIDRDGDHELLVGAPGWNADAGAVFVVSMGGARLGAYHGGEAYGYFGHAVAAVGDMDGDGAADVVVGAPSGRDDDGRATGTVSLLSGKTGRSLWSVSGDGELESLGESLAVLGDVNGDGAMDVAVGAPGAASAGRGTGAVRILSGRDGRVWRALQGRGGGDRFGASLAAAGDVDGDGVGDLLVGAPGDDRGGDAAGAVLLWSGAGRGSDPLLTLTGALPGDEFGHAVAAPGDVDGDGVPDLAAAAFQMFNGGAGSVRVASGADGRPLAHWSGRAAGVRFGDALEGVGDVDGDGLPDLAVGAPYDESGRVLVYGPKGLGR